VAASYVGTFGGAESSSFDSTLSWTTTRTIESGEHVVVVVSIGSGAVSVSSITVGSLSLSADLVTSADGDLEFWSARATAQISSGATVTVTMSADSSFKGAVGEVLAGIETASYVRATASNENDFGSSIASGTSDGTPAADDLALGAVYIYGDSTTDISSASNGYTLGGDDGADPWGLGVSGAMQAAYKVLTAAGATSTNFGLTGSIDASGGLVVYKSGAAGGASAFRILPPRVY